MSDEQKPQWRCSGLYAFLRMLACGALKTLWPTRFHNRERLDIPAPYILIGNHQSWKDPLPMAVAVRHEQLCLVGKRELSAGGVLNKIMKNLHVVLVNRHSTDMEAMRACMKVVREGHILAIFPEGTRHHQGLMEELESGTAMIALRAGVPMIPMLIPTKMKLFRRNDCYVGQPIPMDDLRERGVNKETCAELLQRMTAAYAEMAETAAKEIP